MRFGQEFNVIIGDEQPGDRELFFGPLEPDEQFHIVSPNAQWSHLLRMLGLFRSTSDARRNGWDKDIPDGFSDIRVGKLKVRITVLKLL